MLFNSIDYLIFFPIVVLCYFIFPQKFRNAWLLIVSYFFYMNWNAKYALLLAGSTVITYAASLFIAHFKEKKQLTFAKLSMFVCVFLNLGLLFYFKYANFFVENLNRVLSVLHMDRQLPGFDILLPVGISFYIFQALGYTIDVYRGKVKATRNLFRYALFVSFFPQLVAGPIERSDNLLPQFDEKHEFDVERIRRGMLQILWGLFMKIVIADNIAAPINMIYENFMAYSGVEIILATVLFAVQIYCDFAGYSNIAVGSARVLGFRLMDNFDSPYLACSVTDFWRRWHKSLTSWFTDYVYISLGGNRKGKVRTYVNNMIVFLISGLWHGAEWTYIAWGGLNGLYLVVEKATVDFRKKIRQLLHVKEERFSYKLWQRVVTFFWVDLAWMFFRSTGFSTTFQMLKRIVTNLEISKLFGWAVYNIGLDTQTILVISIALLLLFVVDYMKYRNIDTVEFVMNQGIWFRWFVYLGLLGMILIYGAYGHTYTQTEFIYFQF